MVEAVGSCENELQDVGKSLSTRAEASPERKWADGGTQWAGFILARPLTAAVVT